MTADLRIGTRGRLLAARVLLGFLTAAGLGVGAWAQVAPSGFYRDFPGLGRHWLPPLGPYNEHLVRDFGALSLGLAAAALVAAAALTRSATVTAAAAWLAYAVPHLAFHALHGAPFTIGDDVAVLVSLATEAVAAGAALWLVLTAPVPARSRSTESTPRATTGSPA